MPRNYENNGHNVEEPLGKVYNEHIILQWILCLNYLFILTW